ncbi:Serine/threonine-protein phosphatase 2A activator [Fasciola hepatica]|uniref:Serine/threonine-protein phosphatase 2A activator n=1 Tax=Fasciola hepatica TaxID=6192 RepID=A0A4E0RFQ1_FASHE|nr:Serine/threonine-protein phosphatase 2A activator [Fasciola hepatica]
MPLEKRINNPQDVRAWTVSKAYHDVMNLIQLVSKYITSRPIKPDIPTSTAVSCICELLSHMNKKIDSFPCEEQPQRFGNKSYRLWFQWMSENAKELCRSMLFEKCGITTSVVEGVSFEEILEEVAGYFTESFGNSTRIDYGTGHELAFIAFLACLFKSGVLHAPGPGNSGAPNDYVGIGLVITPSYLQLVRRLQIYYRMEPAGSHGVWCLDDFQFVPFIWGSSQLIGHGQYGPSSIPERHTAEEEKDRYLLFSCIDYIYQVLGKFPVVQHFLFGQLLTMDRTSGPSLSLGDFPGAAGATTRMAPPSIIPSRSVPTGPTGKPVPNESETSSGNVKLTTPPEHAS